MNRQGGFWVESAMFNVYDIQNIIALEDKSILPLTSSIDIPASSKIKGYGYNSYALYSDKSTTFFIFGSPDEIITIYTTSDTSNLIGIEYKGKFFTQIQPQLLSATKEDVKSGNTFIGYNGIIETGTLEVQE